MQKHISFFKLWLLLSSLLVIISCSGTGVDDSEKAGGEFTFAVLNVGQGLSQAGMVQGNAVFWDMGDINTFNQWLDGYSAIGKPAIKAIVISHGDLDHKGGLSLLPDTMPFSGLVITSPYEDTAALRNFAQSWSPVIQFKTVKQGDTLALLDNVYIECLWPPNDSATIPWVEEVFTKNRFSLCFKIVYGNTSLLITSDIDTVAAEKLVERYTNTLSADMVVVPHHGSRGSLHALFYGYVHPVRAIISCGMHNQYGHPADEVVKFLALQMVVTLNDTRYDGHVIGRTNKEYWVWCN